MYNKIFTYFIHRIKMIPFSVYYICVHHILNLFWMTRRLSKRLFSNSFIVSCNEKVLTKCTLITKIYKECTPHWLGYRQGRKVPLIFLYGTSHTFKCGLHIHVRPTLLICLNVLEAYEYKTHSCLKRSRTAYT